MPTTPPDLFLVTRNSPNISQSLWENFQPDQLFPDGANIFPDLTSAQDSYVDPQLQMPSQLQNPEMQSGPMGLNQQPLAGRTTGGTQNSPPLVSGIPGGMSLPDQQQPVFGIQNQQQWPMQGLDPSLAGAGLDPSSQDDSWSSSSRGHGPSVPTALNVEDWYVLFNAVSVREHYTDFQFSPGSNSLASTEVLAI
jgi:hypothetical protein